MSNFKWLTANLGFERSRFSTSVFPPVFYFTVFHKFPVSSFSSNPVFFHSVLFFPPVLFIFSVLFFFPKFISTSFILSFLLSCFIFVLFCSFVGVQKKFVLDFCWSRAPRIIIPKLYATIPSRWIGYHLYYHFQSHFLPNPFHRPNSENFTPKNTICGLRPIKPSAFYFWIANWTDPPGLRGGSELLNHKPIPKSGLLIDVLDKSSRWLIPVIVERWC